MNFKIPYNVTSYFCTGVCLLGGLVAIAAIASGNIKKAASDKAFQSESVQKHQARARALEIVAKEYRIRNCWQTDGDLSVDLIAPTTSNGLPIPSSCVRNKQGSQFAYIAQYNGALRLQFVFTQTEVINQLSRMK